MVATGINFSFIGLLVLSVQVYFLMFFIQVHVFFYFGIHFHLQIVFSFGLHFLFGDAIFIYATPVLVYKCAALTS